jgi:uncharacterized protein (DUF488 family)
MNANTQLQELKVFTIGHSTRATEEFIELLQSNGVRQILDIRTIPKSRRNPQFNSDSLAMSLGAVGIGYVHMKELGGLRHAKADSINIGWRNASFRGYADYMQTPEFAKALDHAIVLAKKTPSALMCAEAVPWRCHRSLVADALLVRGIPVFEIISAAEPKEHKLTPFAHVDGTTVTYPGDQLSLLEPDQASTIKDSADTGLVSSRIGKRAKK